MKNVNEIVLDGERLIKNHLGGMSYVYLFSDGEMEDFLENELSKAVIEKLHTISERPVADSVIYASDRLFWTELYTGDYKNIKLTVSLGRGE